MNYPFPQPCGWCLGPVYSSEGWESHAYGRCIGRSDRANVPPIIVQDTKPTEPTTVLTITWKREDELTGHELRQFSRALARRISERFPNAEVHVKTNNTLASPDA